MADRVVFPSVRARRDAAQRRREKRDRDSLNAYPVARGIPVSDQAYNGKSGPRDVTSFPWRFLAVGDSFFVPFASGRWTTPTAGSAAICNAAATRSRYTEESFIVRWRTAAQEAADGQPARDGWRVWRTG